MLSYVVKKVSELSDEINITTGTFQENTNLNIGN